MGQGPRLAVEVPIIQRVDILSQLFESQLRLGFAVRVVKDMHQLPDNIAEAMHKPGVLFSRAAMACFSSTDTLPGFLRRLQRNFQSVLACSMTLLSVFSSPFALMFLREDNSAFLRCPQIFGAHPLVF